MKPLRSPKPLPRLASHALGFLGLCSLLVTALPLRAAAGPSETEVVERGFEETLQDVLTDFEVDLRKNELAGLKNVHIRSVKLGEGLPESFKLQLENLLAERLLRSSGTAVIPCPACRTRQLTPDANGKGSLALSGPQTEREQLLKIARKAGIQSFLDVAFAYQPSGITLSLAVTGLETGALAASKTYSSERSPTAARRRGLPPLETDPALPEDTAGGAAKIQYRLATVFSYLPDRIGSGSLTSQASTALGFLFRGMERYDHFRKEVGFQIETYRSSVSLVNTTSAATTSLWAKTNVALLFVHGWNLARYPDNPQFARGGFILGVGGFYSPGYLTPLARGAYEWRLGRHWGTAMHLGFRLKSAIYSGGEEVGTAGGADAGLGIHYVF